jgi:hypothetical protein
MLLQKYVRQIRNYLQRQRSTQQIKGRKRVRPMLLELEVLENRVVPTGSWQTLTSALNHLVNDGIENMILLSDGTVMVHGGGNQGPAGGNGASAAWYRLTPVDGSYLNGTWSYLTPMNVARMFFPSTVLQNGNVLVEGGEYSLNSQGATVQVGLTSGEIYNSVTNSWSNIANFNTAQGNPNNFGDDPMAVLANGTVLAGYINGPQTYIYSPGANAWTATGTNKLRNDQSDEESWVQLSDGSILSYDIYSSIQTGVFHAQRYIPAGSAAAKTLGFSDQWVDASTLSKTNSASILSNAFSGSELGPALLLPDGRAFFSGDNGLTAYYTPPSASYPSGYWSAGPTIPNNQTTADAPGAVLPDGDILLAVSPGVYPNPNAGQPGQQPFIYPPPTSIYELNPTSTAANPWTDVTPKNFNLNLHSFNTSMLVLPTGQVLLSNNSNQLDVFTPNGSAQPSWAPTITTINGNGNGTATLSGTQLNGLSEGAAYGDDKEMSSNYPIIQLTGSDGIVRYARTFNWSNSGVATGTALESVRFQMPAGAPDVNQLTVIANGIASKPIVFVSGDANVLNNSITLDTTTFFGSPFVTVNVIDCYVTNAPV